MKQILATALILAAVLVVAVRGAQAQTAVSIELVLAVDTSLSVNDKEFALQMNGIAEAFRSPEIIELIASGNGVAVTLLQWAGWAREERSVPWRLLKSPASVLSFAAEITAAKRQGVGNLTAIGTALGAAMHELRTNDYAGQLLKIDLSGDGYSNAGPTLTKMRNTADDLGITINGLAVLTDFEGLDDYFRDQIMVGPGAFVIEAADYEDFARAMKRKLLRELAPQISRFEDRQPAPYETARAPMRAAPQVTRYRPSPSKEPIGPQQ